MNTEITAAELGQLREDCAIIDIRGTTAFDYGHIGGAVSIPLPELETAQLPEGKPVFFIYTHGAPGRSSCYTASRAC